MGALNRLRGGGCFLTISGAEIIYVCSLVHFRTIGNEVSLFLFSKPEALQFEKKKNISILPGRF